MGGRSGGLAYEDVPGSPVQTPHDEPFGRENRPVSTDCTSVMAKHNMTSIKGPLHMRLVERGISERIS